MHSLRNSPPDCFSQMLTHLEPRVSCAVRNSLPRAKDKKRQNRLELDVQADFFKSILIIESCGRSKPLPYEMPIRIL